MVRDLGLINEPITEIFPRPRSIDEWATYMLSKDQINEFLENGFIYGIKVLDANQIEILREQLNEMVIPEHSGREFFYEYHSNQKSSLLR